MTKICIYCKNTRESDFAGREHVLPQSFGKFGSDTPTLHCVCDLCNAYFSKELDQLFARETIEGVTRYRKGILSRESRPQEAMQFSLEENEENGEFGGALIKGVDGKTGQLLGPISQVQVFNIKNKKYEKFPKEKIKDIKLTDDEHGKPGERKLKIFAPSEEEHDAVLEELKKAGISYKEGKRFQPEFVKKIEVGENVKLPVTVEGRIDKVRKRALAKILLNFAAFYLGKDEVLKKEWDKIREFVRFDGDTIKGRVSTEPFWNGQETENIRFASDSYNLRLENQNANVVGVIQLFNLFTYEFILVENYSLPPEKEVAYRFTPGQKPIIGVKMNKKL